MERRLIIFKIRDVQVVGFPIRRLENTIGLKKLFKEGEKVQEEWHIKQKLPEELKMDLDTRLFLRLNQDHKHDNLMFIFIEYFSRFFKKSFITLFNLVSKGSLVVHFKLVKPSWFFKVKWLI